MLKNYTIEWYTFTGYKNKVQAVDPFNKAEELASNGIVKAWKVSRMDRNFIHTLQSLNWYEFHNAYNDANNEKNAK